MAKRPPGASEEIMKQTKIVALDQRINFLFSTPALWAGVDSNRQFCMFVCLLVCPQL